MTQEWKPGDRAMVVVVQKVDGWFSVETKRPNNFGVVLVPPCSLRPMPAPDPLTELERRVVDAAIAWGNNGLLSSHAPNLYAAVDALLAARALKDPVEELRAAWTHWNAGGRVHRTAYQRLERAITTLEAKEIK